MKYFFIFLVVCVAMAAASPQVVAAWPGIVPGFVPYPAARTLVAGPTVVNSAFGHYVAPGYIGPAII
uniref:Cuticle protein n=1 Tax=Bombyx mori TaxID=7091 RepID=A0A8R1WII8_BOMMO|nr:uncharacterized protein LOC101741814 [Bombyx mori]